MSQCNGVGFAGGVLKQFANRQCHTFKEPFNARKNTKYFIYATKTPKIFLL